MAVWESPVRCGDFWGTFKLPATISLRETLLLLKFCLQSFTSEGLERSVNDSSAHKPLRKSRLRLLEVYQIEDSYQLCRLDAWQHGASVLQWDLPRSGQEEEGDDDGGGEVCEEDQSGRVLGS